MMMMFMMLMMFMIMFDPNLRAMMGTVAGSIFYPIIGFEGKYPLLTIFCAGIFTAVMNTVIRHFFTDWLAMAEAQHVQRQLHAEMKKARTDNNTFKLKKLQEQQGEVMRMNTEVQTSQMKSMPLTMLIVIPVFAWLWNFLASIPVRTFSTPWAPSVSLMASSVCFFGNWIVLYSLLSLPMAQVLQRALKSYALRNSAMVDEAPGMAQRLSEIEKLEKDITSAQADGVNVEKALESLKIAKMRQKEADIPKAKEAIAQTREALDDTQGQKHRAEELVLEARDDIENAKEEGLGVDSMAKALDKAETGLIHGDFSSAIYYSKQVLRDTQLARKANDRIKDEVRTLQIKVEDLDARGIDTSMENDLLEKAATLSLEGDSRGAQNTLDMVREGLESHADAHTSAQNALEKASNAMDDLESLSIEAGEVAELLSKARDDFSIQNYSDAKSNAFKASELAGELKSERLAAEEEVSMAQLVYSNARNFGADLSDVDSVLQDAEQALEDRENQRAKKLAGMVREMAEEAKNLARKEG